MRMYQRRMRDKSSKGQTISWPTVGARVIASATLMNASQMRSEYYPNVGAHPILMRASAFLDEMIAEILSRSNSPRRFAPAELAL